MDLRPGGLNQGLTGLISGLGGQKTGLRVLVWVLHGRWGGDGRTDGRTYGRTSGNSPLCPTGHRPFGAAAQKVSKTLVSLFFDSIITDRRTDGPTDRRTKPLIELCVRN